MPNNTRPSTKKRGSGKKKSGLKLTWPEILASAIVLISLGFLLGHFTLDNSSYQGLPSEQELEYNDYDTSCYYYTDDGRLHYEDDNYRSVTVMDVSYVQKEIDWEQVKEQDIDMVMIRLGFRGYNSGINTLDEFYERNVEGARKAGIKMGVYFFSQAITPEEAIEEADFVLKHIKGKHIDGPIAFDMEPLENANRITHLTSEERTMIADAFLHRIETKGHEALLYGNPTWLGSSLWMSRLTKYDVWLAHYTNYTQWPYDYVMWQYTSTGRVPGVTGDVDLSVMLIKK